MADENNLAVFRAQKLTRGSGKKSLGRSYRHQQNHEQSAEITRPERLKNNRTISDFSTYDDVKKFLNKKIDEHNKRSKRALRKDASIGFECVMSFSPDMVGKVDLIEWQKANIDFLESEFVDKGASTVRIDYHESEETPHIHAIFISTTNEGKISTKDFLGGRGDLSKLQDRYAKAMEKFKLSRGYSRYNEYIAIRNMAVQAGYGKKYSDVKAYCDDNGIKIPERKRHTTKYEWMAQLDKRIEKLKQEIEDYKNELANTTAGLIIENLKEQKKQAEERLNHLEKFVSQPNVERDWYAFIDAELDKEESDEIKITDGAIGDGFDW
ncbi:MAG: plasmid recombination protein [Clostridia bacterium]|nr:plasmid recombination protein [Clostridia bacterium]